MTSPTAMIDRAKQLRNEGELEGSEHAYDQAARLASELGAQELTAHALRHLAELAAQRGDGKRSLEAANEAVAIYQRSAAGSLNLANAHRVRALAFHCLNAKDEADDDWRSARTLYRELGVEAGVTECERRLDEL